MVSEISPEILALHPAGGGGVRLDGYLFTCGCCVAIMKCFCTMIDLHIDQYHISLTSAEVSSATPLCCFESCLIQDAAKVCSVASDASDFGEGPPLLVRKIRLLSRFHGSPKKRCKLLSGLDAIRRSEDLLLSQASTYVHRCTKPSLRLACWSSRLVKRQVLEDFSSRRST